jgi:histidine ammonia-lyase
VGAAHDVIRERVRHLDDDREAGADIVAAIQLVRTGALIPALDGWSVP